MIDLEKYLEYFNNHDMFSVKNGMKLVDIGEGYAKAEITLNGEHLNYMGSLHGGLLYTLADFAAGTALVYYGKQAVTLSSHTEYIKAAYSGKVTAEAKMIARGRTIGRCEVEVYGEDGTLYSKSYISMFITDKDIVLTGD